MKRTWTIIGVGDVARSFRWYRSLLGLPPASPAHDYWGQILDTDGTVLLPACLGRARSSLAGQSRRCEAGQWLAAVLPGG